MTWMTVRRKPTDVLVRYVYGGEDLTGVSVSKVDEAHIGRTPMGVLTGVVAKNPKEPEDMWFIHIDYFREHFYEPAFENFYEDVV